MPSLDSILHKPVHEEVARYGPVQRVPDEFDTASPVVALRALCNPRRVCWENFAAGLPVVDVFAVVVDPSVIRHRFLEDAHQPKHYLRSHCGATFGRAVHREVMPPVPQEEGCGAS